MPIWFLSSSGAVSAALLAPIASPDTFSIQLGGSEVNLDILANDNLRGELPAAVGVSVDDTGLEGTLTVDDNSGEVTYLPPASGGNRQTSFQYSAVGAGGISNVVTVTINLVLDVPTIYETGIYVSGVYT